MSYDPAEQMERGRDYERILEKFENFAEHPDEEAIREFIHTRIKELSERSLRKEITAVSKGFHSGFIHPESDVRRSLLVEPFRVNDDELYRELISTIAEFKRSPSWQGRSVRDLFPHAVQRTLATYFGNPAGAEDTERRNVQFYTDRTGLETQPIPLKDLKGEGIAVCAEKAAAAQNLTSFAGLESHLIMSQHCRLPESSEEQLHAYNVIATEKGAFIYDPTNPRVVRNDADGTNAYYPAIYGISREQFEGLRSGQGVTVEHTDSTYSPQANAMTTNETTKRVYGGAR